MADKTGIEWTDATWNPVTGCTKVSQGCKHCYAERDWARLSANPATKYSGRAFTDVATHRDTLALPCRWSKPRRIFVNSMSDLFHEAVPFEFIAAVFGVMAAASWHTFQVLTKRPQRALDFFAWLDAHPERRHFDTRAMQKKYPGEDWHPYPFFLADVTAQHLPFAGAGLRVDIKGKWPLPNVWLGVSVEDQAAVDERVPLLLGMPAAVRFLSVEPMLGPIDIRMDLSHSMAMLHAGFLRGGLLVPSGERMLPVDWVIVGGESGPHARPMHPDWARSLRDQCAAAGVPFIFKQWGEWGPSSVDDVPSRFSDPALSQFRVISTCGFVCEVNFGAALLHRPQTHPKCFPNAEHSDAICEPCFVRRIGKKAAGRLLDGVEHNGYPEVRQ